MPDLTIEYIRICAANIHWTKQVAGSKGAKYEVDFREGVWSCSCPSFQYRKGECKHILQAKQEKCEWNVEAYCGSRAGEANPDGTCPICGGDTAVIKVGV